LRGIGTLVIIRNAASRGWGGRDDGCSDWSVAIPRPFQMPFPENRSQIRVHRQQRIGVCGKHEFLNSPMRYDAAQNGGCPQDRVAARGQSIFPKQLEALYARWSEYGFVFLPAALLRVCPLSKPVRRPHQKTTGRR